MKAVVIADAFGLEHVRVEERPHEAPARGQVLLRMRAASLNYRDLLMVRGSYNPKQPLPLVLASDGAGEVAAVGEGVTRVKVGDRVCPIFAQAWLSGEPTTPKLRSTLGGPLDGTLVEYRVLDADGVVRVPDHLSDVEAACLPCAAVTAWNSLVTLGRVRPGQTVVTQGTGGVSIFAVQFAKILGARVIATSSSDEKLARLRELGASETINYEREPEWGKVVKQMTDGRGVDLVVEVGGGKTLEQSLRAVRPGGHVSMIGVLSGNTAELKLLPIVMQGLRLNGVQVGHRESFEAMNRAIAQHRLRPVVDRVFALDETRAALDHLASGAHFGKVSVTIQ